MTQLIDEILHQLTELESAPQENYAPQHSIADLQNMVSTEKEKLQKQKEIVRGIIDDPTKTGDFDMARQYLCQLKKEVKEAMPYQLGLKTAKKLGNLMINALQSADHSEIKQKLTDMLNKDKSTWSHKEKAIARCLACSTTGLEALEEKISSPITAHRTDYKLTFPSNNEYDAYFQKFLTDHTEGGGHDVNLNEQPEGQKIHMILCDKNSKTDVINATEQYMRKLKIKNPTNLTIKLVTSEDQLQKALTITDEKKMSVSFTNISHATDATMGYIDLDPNLKHAIVNYANDRKNINKKKRLEEALGTNDMSDLIDLIDYLIPPKSDDVRSSASAALDNFRTMNPHVKEEPKILAKLINEHPSIESVRMLGCTTAGDRDAAKTYNLLELPLAVSSHDTRFFGGRSTKKIMVTFNDIVDTDTTVAKKIAEVSLRVTRPGVIIKGERGIINPGVDGILRYDSEEIPNNKLYRQRSAPAQPGESVIMIKAPISPTTDETALALLSALIFLRNPNPIPAETLEQAQKALVSLKTSATAGDLPQGWKPKYIQAIIKSLEEHLSSIQSQSDLSISKPI